MRLTEKIMAWIGPITAQRHLKSYLEEKMCAEGKVLVVRDVEAEGSDVTSPPVLNTVFEFPAELYPPEKVRTLFLNNIRSVSRSHCDSSDNWEFQWGVTGDVQRLEIKSAFDLASKIFLLQEDGSSPTRANKEDFDLRVDITAQAFESYISLEADKWGHFTNFLDATIADEAKTE